MKRWIGPMLALSLAGCDTIGGIRYDFDSGNFGDKTRAVMNACAARMHDPVFGTISGKVELIRTPPDGPVPFAILSDNATPAPDEQQAIQRWAQTVEACQADARRLIDTMPLPPEATPSQVEKLTGYITDAWVEGSKLRVALHSGKISYADYASQRQTAAEDTLKAAERYAQDMDEESETHDLEDVEMALQPFASLL
jgi:hypothetical protein